MNNNNDAQAGFVSRKSDALTRVAGTLGQMLATQSRALCDYFERYPQPSVANRTAQIVPSLNLIGTIIMMALRNLIKSVRISIVTLTARYFVARDSYSS